MFSSYRAAKAYQSQLLDNFQEEPISAHMESHPRTGALRRIVDQVVRLGHVLSSLRQPTSGYLNEDQLVARSK